MWLEMVDKRLMSNVVNIVSHQYRLKSFEICMQSDYILI